MSAADLLIVYRHPRAADPRASHVGLGVNALHTCKALRAGGVACDVAGVRDVADIEAEVARRPPTTHLVVEAPFLPAADLLALCMARPRLEVACRVHSQVGFLQVEAGAVVLIRDYLRLQDHLPNFRLAENSPRLAQFLDQVYHSRTLMLPNLYHSCHGGRATHRPPAGTVRVGSFGAIRLLKNHITSAAAALILASLHRLRLEFHMSVNREENGRGVLDAIRALFAGVPRATLVEVPWQSWSDFRRTVASMDLCYQLSMTETMNIVTADAVAAGVPVVVGEAIDWVPPRWAARIDDAEDAARVGYGLLSDPHAAADGLAALGRFNAASLSTWKAWLRA